MTIPRFWHPSRHRRRRPNLLIRGRIIQALRDYFLAQDFVEVETPALQISPGLEPHLKAFGTEIEAPDGSRSALYLHTSPEFTMKKLLAAGETRIFQFARVFRNGERASTHHPEFTMLEWYRAHAGYLDLIEDCAAVLRIAAKAAGVDALRHRDHHCDPHAPFQRLSVHDAFRIHAGVDLDRLSAEDARRLEIRVADDASWEDVFFAIFLARVEPKLGSGAGTILLDYPISMAALARAKPGHPELAERFELYAAGLELANAFGELTDRQEQERRFAADREKKLKLYGEAYPIDADFLDAVAQLPPSAGIALGLDRLVMLCVGAPSIEDVIWAPVA